MIVVLVIRKRNDAYKHFYDLAIAILPEIEVRPLPRTCQ